MRGKAKKTNKFGSGWSSIVSPGPIKGLLERRKERKASTKKAVGIGDAVGLASGLVVAVSRNPSFREGLVTMIAVGGAVAIVGGASTFAAKSKKVRQATHLVGKGLAEEAKKSEKLRDFVGNYRYIIIDRKGNIKGTNRSRGWTLGIGRIRLESRKILAGKY